MKFIKAIRFFMALAILGGSAALVSCSKDDEPEVEQATYDVNNVTFSGVMETTAVRGEVEYTYKTEDSKWTFVVDADNKTCTVTMTDAKFAEKMPPMVLQLRNLVFDPDTQTVTGENIQPYTKEGDGMTLNPMFVFTNFKATFNDRIRNKVSVTFEVAGMGKGKFTSTGVVG